MPATPTIPDQLGAANRRRRGLIDAGWMILAFLGTLAQVLHGGITADLHGQTGLDAVGLLLLAASAVPLLAVRRHPLIAYAASTAACATLAVNDYPIDLIVAPGIALYRIAATRRTNQGHPVSMSILVVGALALFVAAAAVADSRTWASTALHTALLASAAWFAGERTGLQREHIAGLRERAQRAEQDAERERQLAISEERTRIARELHDSAGHAINVIAVQAGGARLRSATESTTTTAALAAIESQARTTAEEIDDIVRSLRTDVPDEPEDNRAPAGLASLDSLLAYHEAAGLTVQVTKVGSGPRLSAIQDRAAYRIIQEALANAARHGSRNVQLTIEHRPEELALTATNTIASDRTQRCGGGHGIIGMRERARLLGGTLDTQESAGMFTVIATIPYRDHHP